MKGGIGLGKETVKDSEPDASINPEPRVKSAAKKLACERARNMALNPSRGVGLQSGARSRVWCGIDNECGVVNSEADAESTAELGNLAMN